MTEIVNLTHGLCDNVKVIGNIFLLHWFMEWPCVSTRRQGGQRLLHDVIIWTLQVEAKGACYILSVK